MFVMHNSIWKDIKTGKLYSGQYLDHECNDSIKDNKRQLTQEEILKLSGTGKMVCCDYDQLFYSDQLILCNNIIEYGDWYNDVEVYNGCEERLDDNGEVIEDDYVEVYQYYIISEEIAEDLAKHTDELIWYHKELDIYILGVTHYGTAWGYVSAAYYM